MAFRATRLLRMRIDGSHQGNQMFGPPVCKTAYLDGSGPTFSAKKYVQPAPLRKLRPRSMPRYPCVPRVNSIEKWAKYKEDYHLRFKCPPPPPPPPLPGRPPRQRLPRAPPSNVPLRPLRPAGTRPR